MSSSNMHDLTYFISDCQHNIILPYSGFPCIYIYMQPLYGSTSVSQRNGIATA